TVLLEACARLRTDYFLLIVGAGPEAAAMRARILELGLQEHVDLRRSVPSRDMPALLQGMDALVLPSLSRPNWTEQFGRILVEAMACGIPVVGSTSGEIPNVVGEAGIIVPEGDVEALTAAIERLVADRDLRAKLGRQGRQWVLE